MVNKNILESKFVYYSLFISIISLGIILRFWNLGFDSLKLDEAQSIWQASHSLEFIRDYMLKNVHLPLHNSLLHIWLRFFGTSTFNVRLLSIIPGILCLPAVYFLSREILNKNKALFALFIASISPFWIWYSREIRMYTLLALFSILSYLFFIRILKYSKPRDYLFYLLVNLVGIYTHYFFAFALIVQALFFLLSWNVKFNNKKTANKKLTLFSLALIGVAVLGAFSPWLISLIRNYGSGTYAPVLATPTSFNIALSFFEFTFGYQPDFITSLVIAFWPLVVLFGFVFLTKRQNPFPNELYMVILGILLPVTVIYVISLTIKPIYLTRYLFPVTPLYIILMTWFLSELKGNFRFILCSLFILVTLSFLGNQYVATDNPFKENYKDAIAYINENATSQDLVALAPPYILYPFQYYYEGDARVATMPIWNKKKGGIPAVTPERIELDARTLQRNNKSVYLLIAMDLQGSQEIKTFFDLHYTKLDKKQFSKNIWLHVYKTDYSDTFLKETALKADIN